MSKKTVLYLWGLLFSVVSLKGMENPKIIITTADDIHKLIDARNLLYPKRTKKLETVPRSSNTLEVKPHQLPGREHMPTYINNNTK